MRMPNFSFTNRKLHIHNNWCLFNYLKVPVYKGAVNPLLNERKVENPFFGEDGFGDTEYETDPDMSLIKPEHGVNAMYRMAKEVSILYLLIISD